MLSVPPALSESYSRLEKGINETISRWIAELHDLAKSHNEHISRKADIYYKHNDLKRKLLSREPMDLNEATGQAIAEMLQETKEVNKMESPYQVKEGEVERTLEILWVRFQEIKK